MSIKKVDMYTVNCDGCGRNAFEYSGEYAWNEKEFAVSEAENEGFVEIGGKHYCPECVEWNEDETELIPKKNA